MKNHNLKTWPEFYQAVIRGEKTFEVRLNDRGYEVGDTLTLQEFDPAKQEYTGNEIVKQVPYILREPYAKDGHVIMSLKEVSSCDNCRWDNGSPHRTVYRECVEGDNRKDTEG